MDSSKEAIVPVFLDDIKKQLLSEYYEHPFKWDPRNTMTIIRTPDEILVRVSDQLNVVAVDAALEFEYLMYYIGQSYAYATVDKLQESLDSLQRGEDKLNEFTNNSPEDTMYGQAFLHITMSMRAFLLMLTENLNAASKVLANIPTITGMDIENRAAMEGLRGIFYGEYGFEGFKMTVEFLSKAIEINADESSWHFLKGKYLSRLRHVERHLDLPNEEEIYHLELAARLKKNGTYLLFLAQMYREMAKCSFKFLRNSPAGYSKEQISKDKKKSFELNEKSSKLYKESLELNPECPQTLFRCAKGFMQLPMPFRQDKLAKNVLDKGLNLIPDSAFGHHTMAQYYERIEKNPQKAMEHLKVCEKQKVFPAVMDLVRLECQVCGTTDVARRLEALLDNYNEKLHKCQIFALLSSYHLLSLNDLRKACQYASEIKRLNSNYDCIMKHQPSCVRGPIHSRTINLKEILMDEIKIAVQDESKCSVDDRKYFEAFFEDFSSSSDKAVSITEEPRYVRRKIIADAEKTDQPSTSRVDVTKRKEIGNKSNSSFRDHVSKFKFSKPWEEKQKRAASVNASSSSWRKNDGGRTTKVKNSVPKGKDETNCDNEGNDSGEEIVESMEKIKMRDSQTSDEEKRTRMNPLMMAVLNKYRD